MSYNGPPPKRPENVTQQPVSPPPPKKQPETLAIKICDPLEIGAMYANADTTRFRKFVDKAKAGELSFTCSFVWQPLPEPVSVEAGHRIKHPNGCLIEITEDGIKINELVDIKLRKTQS
jgi:hypothetical protein